MVDAYAPWAKSVLEPAGGTGRFAVGRPANDFTLQEINPTSARIAKILHPKINVRVGPYESNFFDDAGRVHWRENPDEALYDLVVGNFHYGANAPIDAAIDEMCGTFEEPAPMGGPEPPKSDEAEQSLGRGR